MEGHWEEDSSGWTTILTTVPNYLLGIVIRVHPRQDCGKIASAISICDKLVLDVPTSQCEKNTIQHAATSNKFLLGQKGRQRQLAAKSPMAANALAHRAGIVRPRMFARSGFPAPSN